MEKNLIIKVKINTELKIKATPNLNDWNEASEESKNIYIKERITEHLLDNIDFIVDDLVDNSKFELDEDV